MKNIELATPQRGTSWSSLITEIEKVGRENGKAFPIEKEKQIRSVISGEVKPRFSERVYRANKTVVAGTQVLWVYLDKYIN